MGNRTDERWRLFEMLRRGADNHAEAEGAESAWGDFEELFFAAFVLLDEEQHAQFWDSDAVTSLVQDNGDYAEASAEIYGTSADAET